jgi:hypothetical protein
MPGVEQKTPLALLPQERQPSVHAVHEAFGPFANSSSRGSTLSFDTGAVTGRTFECLMTSGKSAANIGRGVKPARAIIENATAATAIRMVRGMGCSLDIRSVIMGFLMRRHRKNDRARCGVMSRYRCKTLTRWPARRKAASPMLVVIRRQPNQHPMHGDIP